MRGKSRNLQRGQGWQPDRSKKCLVPYKKESERKYASGGEGILSRKLIKDFFATTTFFTSFFYPDKINLIFLAKEINLRLEFAPLLFRSHFAVRVARSGVKKWPNSPIDHREKETFFLSCSALGKSSRDRERKVVDEYRLSLVFSGQKNPRSERRKVFLKTCPNVQSQFL